MKYKIYLLLSLLALTASACTMVSFEQQAAAPQKTQLETREFQTREFDTNNTKLIMKAMINVLQDDGFVIKNAVTDLGLISATKEIDIASSKRTKSDSFWETFFVEMAGGNNNRRDRRETVYNKFKVIEASINVSELGRRSKVRANFQAKILDNNGNPVDVSAVDDAKFYQDFFSKVDKSIFIQKQGL